MMDTILFTTYPDPGPCIFVITDMPAKEAEKIQFSPDIEKVTRDIQALGYTVQEIYEVHAVMDWVNGFVEKRQ